MAQHTVITGANRGIGLELCRQYAADGWRVSGVCRGASEELRDSGVEIVEGVDVASADGPGKLAEALAGEAVDLLINCAGILRVETLDDLDVGSIREQFEVNALAPLRVTHALLGAMNKPAKVAMITSRMGSIGDNTSGSRYGYRASKAALNAFGKSLALDLADRGISVAILHPGFVRTGMTRGNGDVSPETAASRLRERIAELGPDTSGQFRHANGETLPW